MLTVNTCTGTVGPDTVLEVYGGSGTPACPPMGSPAPLACNDNSGCGVGGAASSMTQSVTTGQSFLIRLGAGAAGATTGDLLVSCVPAVGTSGACCVGTGCQTVSQTSCTSLGGTFQGTGTRCGVFVPFTAVSTAARVHTCNSNYDTLVRILDGCGGNVLAENDNCSASSSGSDPNAPCFNAPGVTTSCLCFPSQPGATYFVQILFAPGGPPPPGSSTSFSIIHTTDCGG
jgi:hypothetical protein